MQSIFSRGSNTPPSSSSSKGSQGSPVSYSHTLPNPRTSNNSSLSQPRGQSDIHSPMQSMFSPRSSSANFNNFNSGSNSKTSPLHIQTDKNDITDGSIPIPVKHIPIAKA